MTSLPNKQDFSPKQNMHTTLFEENRRELSRERKKLIQIIASERGSLVKDSKELLCLDCLLGRVESFLPNGEDLREVKAEIFGYVLGRHLARQKVPYGILSFGPFFQVKNSDVFVIDGLQSVLVTNVNPEKRYVILKQIIEELVDDPSIAENIKKIIRLGADSGMILSLSESEATKALQIAQDTKDSFLRFHDDVFNKCFDVENYPCLARLDAFAGTDTSRVSASLVDLKPVYIDGDIREQEEEDKQPEEKEKLFNAELKAEFDLFGVFIGQRFSPEIEKAAKEIYVSRDLTEYADIELLTQVLSFCEKKTHRISQDFLHKIFFVINERRAMIEQGQWVPSLGTIFEFGQHEVVVIEQAFFVLVTNVVSNETNLLSDLLSYVRQAESLSEDTKKVFQLCYEAGLILTPQLNISSSAYTQVDFEKENSLFIEVSTSGSDWDPLKTYFSPIVYDQADNGVLKCKITQTAEDFDFQEKAIIITNYLIFISNHYLTRKIERLGSLMTFSEVETIYHVIMDLFPKSSDDVPQWFKEELRKKFINIVYKFYRKEMTMLAQFLIKTNQAVDKKDAGKKLFVEPVKNLANSIVSETIRVLKKRTKVLKDLRPE